ncbi:ComF family protein [Candidatus Sumerlaeota bacterium]|nr:ComF family protein [Candidatus Sumerlaeota bacterium]
MLKLLYNFASDVLALAFPRICPVCGGRVADDFLDAIVCESCRSKLQRALPPHCERCGRPDVVHHAYCCSLMNTGLHFDQARAYCLFEDYARRVVHDMKFNQRRELAEPMAGMMARAWIERLEERRYDCLIPVPLHPSRRHARGYNQSDLLAERLGDMLDMPVDCWNLERRRNTRPQSSLRPQEKVENVRGAFTLDKPERVKGCEMLLIDDIITTGSTANECARVLREAGAVRIDVLTFARTR